MKQTLIRIIILVLAISINYVCFFKTVKTPLDVSIQEKRINSLNNEIKLHNQKVKQLDSLVDIQKTRIYKLENKLSQTAAKAVREEKQHEEDLKRINAMSNSDLVALFTETFK